MTHPTTPDPNAPLYFHEVHPEQSTTVLLINGAFGTYHGALPLTTHLPARHILIPNLHCYGASSLDSPSRPLSLPRTTDLLAGLIRSQAKNRVAHVVGCSMGATLALDLASRYPDLVSTLYVTGYSGFGLSSPTTRRLLPYGFWANQGVEKLIPRRLVTWAMEGDLPANEHGPPNTVRVCREVTEVCGAAIKFETIQARTMIVCAGKRGVLPTDDNLEAGRMAWRGIVLEAEREKVERRDDAGKSVLVRMVEMRHPWWLLRTEEFARSVEAWMEKGMVLEVEGGVEIVEGHANAVRL